MKWLAENRLVSYSYQANTPPFRLPDKFGIGVFQTKDERGLRPSRRNSCYP